jgi:hypothetical protein
VQKLGQDGFEATLPNANLSATAPMSGSAPELGWAIL